ncbi:hypothetical protein [Bacillus toyonensis]|uniref:hypothetical protein n=1 Tax=Bacillus toyonensis TaxID=155322 RepID=UPI00159B9985|nr:hypothetical protein [Bacillus toyonensis]
MSQVNLPNITPTITLTRKKSLNLLLDSIALEELGLAHIINAKAEKILVALDTLPDLSPFPTISQILAINTSVNTTIKNATKKEMLLQNKLESVLQAPSLTGPTGPSGPIATNINAFIVNLTATTLIPQGTGIPFDTNLILTPGIKHTAGSSVINLDPGTYWIGYTTKSKSPTSLFVRIHGSTS